MYIILLKFTDRKAQAADFLEGHKQWLQAGFERGVLQLAGSLGDGLGGALLARGLTALELKAFVDEDPFVSEGIVQPEILPITPTKLDPRLGFLMDELGETGR